MGMVNHQNGKSVWLIWKPWLFQTGMDETGFTQ